MLGEGSGTGDRSDVGPMPADDVSRTQREVLEEAEALCRKNVVLRYGDAILDLSRDDEKLLSYVNSGDPELVRMALKSLINLRLVSHPGIVETAARYVEHGEVVGIRRLCVIYLTKVLVYNHDERMREILQNCGRRIAGPRLTKDDESVLGYIDMALQIGH